MALEELYLLGGRIFEAKPSTKSACAAESAIPMRNGSPGSLITRH